jgi:ribose 5-phosphate isomerase B
MHVAFGTDERTAVTDHVQSWLRARGHTVEVVVEGGSWVDVGAEVARAVVTGRAAIGVVCCWTGTGVAMAANKIPGARAALCTDAATAAGARRWNDANVLALGLRLTSAVVAGEILEAFLDAGPDAGEAAAIDALGALER